MWVQMEHAELLSMLELLHADGKWLLPKRKAVEELRADTFIKIRDKWEKEGLAVLDFDGQIHPTQLLARLTYNITKAAAAIRYVSDSGTEIYIKGPVDLTHLHFSQNMWTMGLARPSSVADWCKDQLGKREGGRLTTCGCPEGVFVRKEADLEQCEDICRTLAEHLVLFYKEEEVCPKL